MRILFILCLSASLGFAFEPAVNVAEKKALLKSRLSQTENWLREYGEKKLEGWQSFLKWEALLTEISKPKPDLNQLKDFLNRWRVNQVGLEAPLFVSSQKALREYIKALEISQEENFLLAVESRRQRVEQLRVSREPEARESMGPLLGWLESAKQEQGLVSKVRSDWSQPNLKLEISSRLLAYGLEGTKVSNEQYTSAVILGVAVGGVVQTKGTVTAMPVASVANGVGIIEFQLRASVDSPHQYGQKGSVGLHSRSHAEALITKRIHFSQNGIFAERARGTACTESELIQIDARPLVRRIAARQAERKQSQANCEASQITAQRIALEFDKQIDAQLKKLQEEQARKMKQTLEFQGVYPTRTAFRSTLQGLTMLVEERNSHQLAAPDAPPSSTPGRDLNAAVHESFVGNYFESYLGDKVEWDHSWFQIIKLLTLEEPPALRVHDRTPRWYLRVNEFSPMVVRFREGLIQFRISGKEIFRGETPQIPLADRSVVAKSLPGGETPANSKSQALRVFRPVEVKVAYKPVIENGVVYGRRVGEVQVQFSDGKEDDAASKELKAMLFAKMAAFLPAQYELGGLSIPKGSGWERFENLKPQAVEVKEGWLTTSYQLIIP